MMSLETAIARMEAKATRMRILAAAERSSRAARDAGKSQRLDAEAIDVLVATVVQP